MVKNMPSARSATWNGILRIKTPSFTEKYSADEKHKKRNPWTDEKSRKNEKFVRFKIDYIF